jgi:hypothetical protein
VQQQGLVASWPVLSLTAALLALSVLAIGGGFVADRDTHAVQSLANRYFIAVQGKNLQAAIETLDSRERQRWERWVEHQTGNTYQVEAVAVRNVPLLEQLLRGHARSEEVSITARITLESGESWLRPAVTVARLEWHDSSPHFLEPPFHPPGGNLEG